MNELSDDLIIIIFSYAKSNLNFTNKYMNNLIEKERKRFLMKPIEVYYKLVKWTYSSTAPLIINRTNRVHQYRPRMKVYPTKKTKIHKIPLGFVRKDLSIYPSKLLELCLIRPNAVRPRDSIYMVTRLPMYNIWSIWIKNEDYKRAKLYEMLHPCLNTYKYIIPKKLY